MSDFSNFLINFNISLNDLVKINFEFSNLIDARQNLKVILLLN